MVLDDSILKAEPYAAYSKLLESHIDVEISSSIFKRYRPLAIPSYLNLIMDKPYIVFYYKQRHWKIKNYQFPRLAGIAYSLDRFDSRSGLRNSHCLFDNCTHSVDTYGRDWFAVEII